MVMAYAAIHHDLETGLPVGQHRMMEDWFAEYGVGRSIALTDTFGSEFFFRDFRDMAAAWRGLRQDSGDPFAFGERVIEVYRDLEIDPTTKLIVFSAGLTVDTIEALWDRLHDRIKLSFGWGTDLTNDCGIPPVSLVMKLTTAAGISTVKLSDNLAKAMGRPGDVERAKEIYGKQLQDVQTLVY
jgi:nicotinate phosphoribosyltransferase